MLQETSCFSKRIHYVFNCITSSLVKEPVIMLENSALEISTHRSTQTVFLPVGGSE